MLGAHGAVFLRVRGDFLFLEMHFNSETRDGSFDRTARMHSVCFFSFCMARELQHLLRYIVGDVMYLNAFGQPIMVINSLKTAAKLLDQCATVYFDQPCMIVANEILLEGFVSFI